MSYKLQCFLIINLLVIRKSLFAEKKICPDRNISTPKYVLGLPKNCLDLHHIPSRLVKVCLHVHLLLSH